MQSDVLHTVALRSPRNTQFAHFHRPGLLNEWLSRAATDQGLSIEVQGQDFHGRYSSQKAPALRTANPGPLGHPAGVPFTRRVATTTTIGSHS